MQFETCEIRHPRERRRIPWHDLLRGTSGRKFQRDDFDPIRARGWRTLLIEELAVDPVGIAHEHVGAVPGSAERTRGHSEVVADEVQLRETGLREQDLGGIRDRHLAIAEGEELLILTRSHSRSLPDQKWMLIPRVGTE